MDEDLEVAPRALSTAKFLMTPTEMPREKKVWDAASRQVVTLIESPVFDLDAASASKLYSPNHPLHDHTSSPSSTFDSDLGHGRGSSYGTHRTSVTGYQWAAGDAAPPPATNTKSRRRNSMLGSIPAAHQDHFRQSSTGTQLSGSTPDPAAAAGLTRPASSNKAGKPSLGMMAGSLSPQQIRMLHGNICSTGSASNTDSSSAGDSSLPEPLFRPSSSVTKQTHMQQQQALLLSQLGIKAAEASESNSAALESGNTNHTLCYSAEDTALTRTGSRTRRASASAYVHALQPLQCPEDAALTDTSAPTSPAFQNSIRVRRGSLLMSQQQELLLAQLNSCMTAVPQAAAGETATATDENAAQPTSPVARLQRRSRSLDAPISGSTCATPAARTSPKESDVLEQYAQSLRVKSGRRTRSLDPPKMQFEPQSPKQPTEPGKSFLSKLTSGWGILSGPSQQQPVVQQHMHTASALAAVGNGVPADSNNRTASVTPKSGTSGAMYMGPQRTPETPLQKSCSNPCLGSDYACAGIAKDLNRCNTHHVTHNCDLKDESSLTSVASTADSNANALCGQPGRPQLQRNESYQIQYFVPRIDSIDKHAYQRAAESDSTHYSSLIDGKHR